MHDYYLNKTRLRTIVDLINKEGQGTISQETEGDLWRYLESRLTFGQAQECPLEYRLPSTLGAGFRLYVNSCVYVGIYEPNASQEAALRTLNAKVKACVALPSFDCDGEKLSYLAYQVWADTDDGTKEDGAPIPRWEDLAEDDPDKISFLATLLHALEDSSQAVS